MLHTQFETNIVTFNLIKSFKHYINYLNHFTPGFVMVKKSDLFSVGFLSYIRHGLEGHILSIFLSPKITVNL